MSLKPPSQMEFTYRTMLVRFAELFLSGAGLILISLMNKKLMKYLYQSLHMWISLENISG